MLLAAMQSIGLYIGVLVLVICIFVYRATGGNSPYVITPVILGLAAYWFWTRHQRMKNR